MSLAKFDPMAMAAGVYRGGAARLDSSIAQVIFYGDGKTASIASTSLVDGSVMISTNGKVDASIQLRNDTPPTVDELTMTMAALLPLSMLADPHSAAVIGFGSGLTTQILLSDPRLSRVDTIEIEPKMVEGAKVFAARVPRAFDDPRSHVIFDDAKSYFAANQSKYDIIVSEPSNPWVSGVASLFSREFYRFIPRHLKPGGLFVQWVQVYGINDELVASIGNAMSGSFTDFRVYFTNDFDMLLLATPSGSLGAVRGEIFQQSSLASQLRRVGMSGTADLDVREAGTRNSLVPLFEAMSRRSNSDFYPILSLEAPRARFIDKRALMLLGLSTADAPVREVIAGLQPPLAERLSPGSTFTPAELTRQAAEIAAALGEPEPSAVGHDPGIFAAAKAVRADFASCNNQRSAADEIDVLIALGGRTIPFLDANHLKGIWSEPRWIACEMQAESSRAILSLLSALGQRQFGVVQPQALALLQSHRRELSPMAQDWLLRIAMLAAIAESRYEDVAGLEASLGGQIPPTESSKVQRIYLTAVAAARARADAGLPATQRVHAAGAKSKD
jgi:SAM-dependent methyltransferase